MSTTNGKPLDWNDLLTQHGPKAIKLAFDQRQVWQPVPVGPAQPGAAGPRVAVGDNVSPSDRDNWGRVVAINGDRATVHFIGASGEATKEFALSELRTADGRRADGKVEPFTVPTMSSAEFLSADFTIRPIVEGILVEGQNCVIGGKQKVLKTSIALDLAISIATGTMFLRRFVVRQKLPVAFLTGESGGHVIQSTSQRIARARGVTIGDAPIRWGLTLPKLTRAEHRAGLAALAKDHGVRVLFLDPLYLALMDGADTGRAGNLFAMGELLAPITDLAQQCGLTIVLLHHFAKSAGMDDRFGPPELEHLTQSGVAEWSRSWLLIGRRERYEPGSGLHRLHLVAGGSAGHGGQWGLDIDEGVADADLGGRKWDVTVETADNSRERQRTAKRAEELENDQRTVLAVLRKHPNGTTFTRLRDRLPIPSTRAKRAINALCDSGEAEAIELEVPSGKNKTRKIDGVRANPNQTGKTGQTGEYDQDSRVTGADQETGTPPRRGVTGGRPGLAAGKNKEETREKSARCDNEQTSELFV